MERLIIDTREGFEYKAGHVQGAVNIPPAKFLGKNLPKELEKAGFDAEIIVYCKTGSRSNVVAHILRSRGFSNIINGINQQHVERILKNNA